MIRVGAFYPNASDATSFYRGAGPFGILRKIDPDIAVFSLHKMDWAIARQFDLVFFQRPCTQAELSAIELARSCGLPVWVDYDDDFYCISRDNPGFDVYGSDQTLEIVTKIAKTASFITVTTNALQKRMRQFNDHVLVLPNAWDDYLLPATPSMEARTKSVVWRGSATHQRDLRQHSDEIIQAAKAFPDFHFHFMGFYPWWITEQLSAKQFTYHEPTDVVQYLRALRAINPAVVVVPLAMCDFNQAKSNIAWLEATFAGAACIASPTEPFQRPGIIQGLQFGSKLEETLEETRFYDGEVHPAVDESFEYIEQHLFLSRINSQRAQIIRGIYEKL